MRKEGTADIIPPLEITSTHANIPERERGGEAIFSFPEITRQSFLQGDPDWQKYQSVDHTAATGDPELYQRAHALFEAATKRFEARYTEAMRIFQDQLMQLITTAQQGSFGRGRLVVNETPKEGVRNNIYRVVDFFGKDVKEQTRAREKQTVRRYGSPITDCITELKGDYQRYNLIPPFFSMGARDNGLISPGSILSKDLLQEYSSIVTEEYGVNALFVDNLWLQDHRDAYAVNPWSINHLNFMVEVPSDPDSEMTDAPEYHTFFEQMLEQHWHKPSKFFDIGEIMRTMPEWFMAKWQSAKRGTDYITPGIEIWLTKSNRVDEGVEKIFALPNGRLLVAEYGLFNCRGQTRDLLGIIPGVNWTLGLAELCTELQRWDHMRLEPTSEADDNFFYDYIYV